MMRGVTESLQQPLDYQPNTAGNFNPKILQHPVNIPIGDIHFQLPTILIIQIVELGHRVSYSYM